MIHYVGLDVSARSINVCVIDTDGRVANERKMGVDPEAVATYLRGLDLCIGRIGLEAGMLSQHIWRLGSRRAAGHLRRDASYEGRTLCATQQDRSS
jgi:hypothetical protein